MRPGTRRKARPASRSTIVSIGEWTVIPERERSRLAVQLREAEDGSRFVTIAREIRPSERHDWYQRRSLSVRPEELEGLAEILEAVR